jgi:hypothetical protein
LRVQNVEDCFAQRPWPYGAEKKKRSTSLMSDVSDKKNASDKEEKEREKEIKVEKEVKIKKEVKVEREAVT